MAATFNPQLLCCEWGGGAMIEAILLEINLNKNFQTCTTMAPDW